MVKYTSLTPTWKKIPEVAYARKMTADMYRAARRENPAMARALRRRYNAAKREIMDKVVNSCFRSNPF